MAGLSSTYMRQHAVYFEPVDTAEAEAIQRRLIDLGYTWGVNQKNVAYVQKCLRDGITALPSGRMFCGEPSDFKVVHHTYEELNGEPLLRAAVQKLSSAVQHDAKALDDLRADVRSETSKLRQSMRAEFDMLARRQQAIEDNQRQIIERLDEVLELLKPKPIDLGIKKTAGKP